MAVRVIRDSHPTVVRSREIVAGDLILLEAGDAIPADGWLLESDGISCDESDFTGRASRPTRRPVKKFSREVL